MAKSTQEVQLGILRIAYRAAKTDAEREQIRVRAAEIKNPPPKEEIEELTTNVESALMTLPDWSHPYWKNQRK